VAYEPVWAIGTGKTPTTPEVAAAHAHIRKVLGGLMAEADGGAAALRRLGERQQRRETAGGGRRRRSAGRRRSLKADEFLAIAKRPKEARSAAKMDSVKAFFHDWRLVLLIIHVGVTAAMIVVILLQRSEGGGLGMGRTDALFSVRGQANVLSRMTAIFAGIFFFLSLLMAWSVGEPGARTTTLDHGQRALDARGAGSGRRHHRPAGDARAPTSAHPLGTTADVGPFPPPNLLRRDDIPMAALSNI
jgi:protein translocase SecG subunit